MFRQRPAGPDGEGCPVVHRHHDPLAVGDTVGLLHDAVHGLGVHAHRLRALQAPEDEVEVVGRLHDGGGEADAPADLVADRARDVAAHQRGDGPPEGAVLQALLHVGVFRVEALRVADGELQARLAGQRHQLVGLLQLEPHRLLEEGVLAGEEAGRRCPPAAGARGSRRWPCARASPWPPARASPRRSRPGAGSPPAGGPRTSWRGSRRSIPFR